MSIVYNPYNWEVRSRKSRVEKLYEENFDRILEKYDELRELKRLVGVVEDEIVCLEEEHCRLLMDDGIGFDFLLSRIK